MWARIVSGLLGIWLIVAPSVLDYGGATRTSGRVIGPMIAGFSVIALWEVVRPLRWTGLPLGLAVVILAAVFGGDGAFNNAAAGVLVGLLAFVQGPLRHRFDGGWPALRRTE